MIAGCCMCLSHGQPSPHRWISVVLALPHAQFLTNIKKLNDHAQSRDETLQKAQDIFGTENEDLFVSFKQLLSKHGLS